MATGTSKQATCEFCGKTMFARGIGTHIRQVHKLKLVKVTKVTTKELKSTTKVEQALEELKSGGVAEDSDNIVVTHREETHAFCQGCKTRKPGVNCIFAVYHGYNGVGIYLCPSCMRNHRKYTDELNRLNPPRTKVADKTTKVELKWWQKDLNNNSK